MPIVGQFASLARAGSFLLPGGAMESIGTITVGSGGASSIEFLDIPGGFSHLQIRFIGRQTNSSASGGAAMMRLNGNTASNYNYHALWGDGASVFADTSGTDTYNYPFRATTGSQSANVFGVGIADILDYASTSKNKVTRSFTGFDNNGAGRIYVNSNLWMSTAAVTSISFVPLANNWAQYTTASLYGIRA